MKLCFATLAALTLFSVGLPAHAAVRVVLRSDYGKAAKPGILESIEAALGDRLDDWGEILTGKPMGGNRDLVIQMDSNGSLELLSCPSIRVCRGDVPCQSNPKFWNCQEIFQGPREALCSQYVSGLQTLQVENWVISEVVGDIVTGSISFFAHGVGLVLTDVSEVVSDYGAARDLIESSCKTNGMSDALSSAAQSGILLVSEKSKNEVNTDIHIFYHTEADNEDDSCEDDSLLSCSPADATRPQYFVAKPVRLDPSDIHL